jgi:drug/metabolite transporter (DMT)-like permease
MSDRVWFILLFLLSALVSSVSQILLKKSALKSYPSRWREYVNPLVIGGYALLFGCTVLVVFAFREVPLSLGPILEASSYAYIMVLSAIFLKEKITVRKIVGNAVIIAGICVFSFFG